MQALSFSAACELAGGVVVAGGCPTDGIVAGCELMAAGPTGGVIDWYYAPETEESVTTECGTDGTVIPAP